MPLNGAFFHNFWKTSFQWNLEKKRFFWKMSVLIQLVKTEAKSIYPQHRQTLEKKRSQFSIIIHFLTKTALIWATSKNRDVSACAVKSIMFEILNNHWFLDKICTYMAHGKQMGYGWLRSSGGKTKNDIFLGSGRLKYVQGGS